ncbi:hypothetical protein F5J12DRAFT_180532 [Pisolithus orientalis]|uniref:uncharacterized protein n=1 Tax=Pisolithus orientalis TaxID=936130 RepID=UPI0022259259|nr:uncharacterized protein F5J12DRAFT_180532 [Pisolithus orientalis]KAI6032667.1 hypothetical protein F5J12DRAFT_180532 [Pisolithus orientalis]
MMSTAEATAYEEGSVEGSLADQEQTSPESHSNAIRPMSYPSPHWEQSKYQYHVPMNPLAHTTSRRSSGTRGATSCIHSSGRARLNTVTGNSQNPEEIPTPSSARRSVATTRVGTDHKASWKAHSVSSACFEQPHQPTDVEADPEANGLHEVHCPAPIPPHISTLHSMPGLHANLYEHVQTPYVKMILAIDYIPNWYTVIAGLSTWMLLAGFVLFPGTFASWATRPTDTAEYEIATFIRNMPLLVIASVCTGLGSAAMVWLWWRWRRNYIWVVSRVFVPGLLNSVAGVISTVTNAYETQGNLSSSNVRATIVVTGTVAVICGVLVVIYQWVFIRRLRKEHERIEGERDAGKRNAGVIVEQKSEEVPVQTRAETFRPWRYV